MEDSELYEIIEVVYDLNIDRLNKDQLLQVYAMANNILLDIQKELYKRG